MQLIRSQSLVIPVWKKKIYYSISGDLGGAAVLWPDFRGAGDSGDAVRPDRGCGAISDLFPEPIQAPGGERQIPELVPSHPGPALRRAAAAAG